MANHSLSWVGPLSLGATLMYLFDPTGGRRRRALLRDQTSSLARRVSETSTALATDVRNRTGGLAARWQNREEDGPVDDAIVEARVRSNLGRASSHPGAIGVASIDGVVTLSGPVLANEHTAVCRAAARAAGVMEVVDQLVPHETAGSVPGLQGDGSMRGRVSEWTPTGRLLAVVSGAGLIAYGMRRRTATGGLVASVGAGLLSRGLVDLDLPGRVTELLNIIDDTRQTGREGGFMTRRTGISNRETPQQEERERQEHPPVDPGSPPPQDAAGRVGEEPLADVPDRQTSHKAGSRSIAQKEDGARYPDRSMPATRKVSGAFGREPQGVAADTDRDTAGSKRKK
jgi:hypothetical protein